MAHKSEGIQQPDPDAWSSPVVDAPIVPLAPMHILPLCCRNLGLVDGSFTALPDRRMAWSPHMRDGQWVLAWQCNSCGDILSLADASAFVPATNVLNPFCPFHGRRAVVLDKTNGVLFYRCLRSQGVMTPEIENRCFDPTQPMLSHSGPPSPPTSWRRRRSRSRSFRMSTPVSITINQHILVDVSSDSDDGAVDAGARGSGD